MFWMVVGLAVVLGLVVVVVASRGRASGGPGRFVLPNGQEVYHYKKGETEIIYKEIWERGSYLLPEPMTLKPGATVIDAGANIGLFSLFAMEECDGNAQVFAFEPMPAIHQILSANAAELSEKGKGTMHALPCGLSDQAGEVTFLHHPKMSLWSTEHPDFDAQRSEQLYKDGPQILAYVLEDAPRWLRWLPRSLLLWGTRQVADAVVETQEVVCQMRTLSDVIDEYAIEHIDLLKVDVEGNEWALLQGIRDAHWPLIQQLALEVEDQATLSKIKALLAEHGFAMEDELAMVVHDTKIEAELAYLWAWRP